MSVMMDTQHAYKCDNKDLHLAVEEHILHLTVNIKGVDSFAVGLISYLEGNKFPLAPPPQSLC